MAVNPDQLTMGPADAYHRAWDGAITEEPTTVVTAFGTEWDDLGGTQGGSTLRVSQTFTALQVDQVVDTPGRRLTGREIQVVTNVAQPTLGNVGRALNAPTVTAGEGEEVYEPVYAGIEATQPPYGSVALDTFAPVQGTLVNPRRRIILRRTMSTEQVELAHAKDSQTLVPTTYTAHYVSPTISPIKVIDQVPVVVP